ncbi:hypothetical protein [Cellulomonas sp. URHB0016]
MHGLGARLGARLGAAAGAAVVVGAATGVVARALMRVLAVALGERPTFSVLASAFIVLFFVVGMGPAAVGGALGRWTSRVVGATASVLLLGWSATVTAVAEGVGGLDGRPTGAVLLALMSLVALGAAVVGGSVLTMRVSARLAPEHEERPSHAVW